MEMKIGELAKSTEVSIRTLHHYDEIGLLKPSQRTESGHRVYNENDILRLHRIIALRKLGLSLEEVGQVVGESALSLQEIFDRNIESLENEIERKKSTLRLLKGALSYLEIKESVDLTDLTESIREFSLHEKYYSKDQLEELEAREQQLGKEAIKDVINEWPILIEKVKAEMDAGTVPSAKEVQSLAKRWFELKDMFSGGNKQLEETTRKLYEENPEVAQRYRLDPAIFEYVQKSAASMKKK